MRYCKHSLKTYQAQLFQFSPITIEWQHLLVFKRWFCLFPMFFNKRLLNTSETFKTFGRLFGHRAFQQQLFFSFFLAKQPLLEKSLECSEASELL